MTALELELEGVTFLRERVRGPRELAEVIRAEVARRRPVVLAPVTEYGRCSSCGDPLRPGRGGMCGLCVLARWKDLAA